MIAGYWYTPDDLVDAHYDWVVAVGNGRLLDVHHHVHPEDGVISPYHPHYHHAAHLVVGADHCEKQKLVEI